VARPCSDPEPVDIYEPEGATWLEKTVGWSKTCETMNLLTPHKEGMMAKMLLPRVLLPMNIPANLGRIYPTPEPPEYME
jgi:hypothetical protein